MADNRGRARPGRAPCSIARRDPARAGSEDDRQPAGRAGRLQREVRLLGALLGEAIVEQAGAEMFDIVELTRRLGRSPPAAATTGLGWLSMFGRWDGATLRAVCAFGLYFQLVNLAEQRARVLGRAIQYAPQEARPREARFGDALRTAARKLGLARCWIGYRSLSRPHRAPNRGPPSNGAAGPAAHCAAAGAGSVPRGRQGRPPPAMQRRHPARARLHHFAHQLLPLTLLIWGRP